MTQVDFYLLQKTAVYDRLLFACRLADKAFGQGNQVYLHTDSEAQSTELDQLLWTFQPGSFIPHQLASGYQPRQAAGPEVLVGHQQPPAQYRQLMINLSSSVPDCFSRFERMIEIVVEDAAIKANSRINYRFYKDRGYPLVTHTIN